MDIATHRIRLNPSRRKDDESVAEGLIRTWKKLGIPDFLQLDNELSFRGSNRWPHSLGLVLRFCLLMKVQPFFIPQGEPWRNGEIESFQNTFDRSFFRSQCFGTLKDLCSEAPRFEDYHNEHYVYGCLNGKTPNQELMHDSVGIQLLHDSFQIPKERIPIVDDHFHFVRFIRSDRKLFIFGEPFTVCKDLVYEYDKATICTDIHMLQIRYDDQLVDAFEYVVPVD